MIVFEFFFKRTRDDSLKEGIPNERVSGKIDQNRKKANHKILFLKKS